MQFAQAAIQDYAQELRVLYCCVVVSVFDLLALAFEENRYCNDRHIIRQEMSNSNPGEM